MNEITINIDNYISEEEKTAIVKEEFASLVRSRMNTEKDIERILTNNGYYFFQKEIDELIPGYKDVISEKVRELITKKATDYSFSVFREGRWGEEKSIATQYVENTVKENRDLIKSTVIEQIKDKDYSQDICDQLADISELFYTLAENLRVKK
jgi:hypothetical protein